MTAPRRRWFHFTLKQIVESVLWVAIGLAMIQALRAMSQEMMNTIWIFAWFLAGAPFGVAIGSLFARRLQGLAVGVVLPILVAIACTLAFAIWSGSWRDI